MPAVLASGWASGVNAYLCVLVLGLFGRFAGIEAVPEALTRTDVLVVAALLYALEFVADKIPYVDSAWDAISTAIRPDRRRGDRAAHRGRRLAPWSRRCWPRPGVAPHCSATWSRAACG